MTRLPFISRQSSRRTGVLAVLGVLALAVVVPAVVSAGGSANLIAQAAKAPPDLDHFKCYTALQSPEVKHGTVGLKDQFGETKVNVGKTAQLCNPVSKNGGKILHKTAHLVCYVTSETSTEPFKQRTVQVTNQFGVRKLTVIRPGNLCLPSLKHPGTVAPTGKPPEAALDHFRCYAVERVSVVKTVKTVDQFKRTSTATTTIAATALCLPVSKNGGKVTREKAHLVCYAIKREKFASRPVRVRNQFGDAALRVNATKSLCLPSFKQVLG